jgi:hypothetical protein
MSMLTLDIFHNYYWQIMSINQDLVTGIFSPLFYRLLSKLFVNNTEQQEVRLLTCCWQHQP